MKDLSSTLVKETKRPRYLHIKEYILQSIAKREFKPGCKIPPEIELAQQFGVSRMTVNKAVRDLAGAGVLLRFAGDGTYVAERKASTPLLEINNIAQEIKSRSHNYTTRLYQLSAEPALDEIALQLGMSLGSTIFRSQLVHFADNIPMQLEDRFVNPQWAPEYLKQNYNVMTPSQYLIQHAPLTDIEHTVEAIMPDSREQDLLSIGEHEPCLLILRRSWSHKNMVSFARLLHPGSRYKLRSQIHID